MELVRGRPSREEKGQRASWRREVWRSGAKASMGGGVPLKPKMRGFHVRSQRQLRIELPALSLVRVRRPARPRLQDLQQLAGNERVRDLRERLVSRGV